ncbi:tyrosine-type recombinase/integrase [Synechococcus moorigangaii CMS01]|nr:tyrosine-type recombinase/integrase [Synechococcus moorigangaii CMS01]
MADACRALPVPQLQDHSRPARQLLGATPKKGVQILLNTRNHPWTASGFKTQFGKAKEKAKISGKRFHDLRGTAATTLCLAGLDHRELADILGWSEKRVADMRRRYVSREAIILSGVERLQRSQAEQAGNK